MQFVVATKADSSRVLVPAPPGLRTARNDKRVGLCERVFGLLLLKKQIPRTFSSLLRRDYERLRNDKRVGLCERVFGLLLLKKQIPRTFSSRLAGSTNGSE